MIRRATGWTTLAVLAVVWAVQAQDTSPQPQDEAVFARNILPPGQGRHVNTLEFVTITAGVGEQPPQNSNQISLYEELIQKAPDLQPEDVETLFKDASFGVEGEVTEMLAPRDGAVVLRDEHGVPHAERGSGTTPSPAFSLRVLVRFANSSPGPP